MDSFRTYISFWAITNVLIGKRVQLSEKRHKKHQLHLISPELKLGNLTEAEQLLLSLMPPRKSWVSLSVTTRYRKLREEHRQREPASRCNQRAIKWSIKRDLAKDEKPSYIERLKDFVNKIQTRVRNEAFSFNKPVLFPEVKDESCSRPLCKFDNLEDAVILILANKYLTELFNDLFFEESLAFRSKRTYHGMLDYVTSHHDAIARIKEYRRRMEGKHLFVCECDLQKFYDTVSHDVVRKSYKGLLKRAAKKHPDLEFDEISRVFKAYLRCYNFPRDVFCKNGQDAFWNENKVKEGRCFKWVEDELLAHGVAKSHKGLMKMHIGVPQGGALSGLIANMVLNTVDWQVKQEMTERDLYLRYCDDMIIISTNKARCKKLFSAYYNGALKLNLVPHKQKKDLEFGSKGFWKSKSKDVYLWDMKRDDASEWIGFVGYEMRRDGVLRVRKKSFHKELDKQRSVVFEKVLDKIKGKERVPNDSLLGSLEKKLVSMSVGKISVWNAEYLEAEMCWSAGFKELEKNPILFKQLRELDRHRGMMLSAAARRIKAMKKTGKTIVRKDLEDLQEEKNPDVRGMVHSYYYQFAREKNDN